MTRDLWMVVVGLAFIACKKDDAPAPAPKPSEAKPEAKAPVEPAHNTPPDNSAEIAARPHVRVTLDDLGLSISVPEGTKPTPQSADRKLRAAHLETGKDGFMVNIDAVDQYSIPSFEKAIEVYKDDKLVEWFRKEQTKTGWITFKHVISSLHKGPRFELEVRTFVNSKRWDCGVSAPNRGYAELALAACQSLQIAGADTFEADKAAADKAAAEKPALKAAEKAAKPAAKPAAKSSGATGGPKPPASGGDGVYD